MFWIEFAVLLLAIYIGIRVGGIGLGLIGGTGVTVFTFAFGMKPGSPPIDVMLIILAVVANTMAMTTRERIGEYAVLKTLGYSGLNIATLIMGEAFVISFLGSLLGIVFTFPVAHYFSTALGTYFPVFYVKSSTVLFDLGVAAIVGVAAAVIPIRQAIHIRIADGLRRIG